MCSMDNNDEVQFAVPMKQLVDILCEMEDETIMKLLKLSIFVKTVGNLR